MEGEKYLEKKLAEEILKIGGWSIKLMSYLVAGLPDRLCLFPDGKVIFVEVKTTGKRPTKIQKLVHKRLTKLGFTVLVIDSSEGIEDLIKIFTNE